MNITTGILYFCTYILISINKENFYNTVRGECFLEAKTHRTTTDLSLDTPRKARYSGRAEWCAERNPMIHQSLQAIILAAGKSSRFNTGRTKFLSTICGQELILYPIKALADLAIPTSVVINPSQEHLKHIVLHTMGDSVTFIDQDQPNGTAHAVGISKDSWFQGAILIMHGDLPLITSTLIQDFYKAHSEHKATISFIAAHNADPALIGYDRITKTETAVRVINAENADAHENCCVNAGIYIVEKNFLESVIDALESSEKECSFSSILEFAHAQGVIMNMFTAPFDKVRGVNTVADLWAVEHIKKSELIKYWMEKGVTFTAPATTHLDLRVTLSSGTTIASGVHLMGNTSIGHNVKIHEFSLLENSIVADNAIIFSHSVIKDSYIGSNTKIGPFAHLRDESSIADNVIVGNFVEIKKSSLDEQTKVKHLSYLGDAKIGSHVNIGAGTITANHNGITKNKTIIEDNAYIGVHTTLVAPVTVGTKAFTAAGSVITADVPADALAIARARQVTKEGYAQKLRERASGNNESAETPTTFGAAVKTRNDTVGS